MTATILIIEDDPDLVTMLVKALDEAYKVVQAGDGWTGVDLVSEVKPDLILLDLLLPGIDGWEVCRRIRHESNVPIIALTALGHEQHIIRALDLGADDYVTKPFHVGELRARIRAALRRAGCPAAEENTIQVDDRLVIDRGKHSVTVDGESMELSVTEFNLLTYMLDNAGRILTHDRLLTQVWGWDQVGQTNYVKVYIHRLRKKIEENPAEPRYIITERGLGYRFQLPGS